MTTPPPGTKFVAIKSAVMQGQEQICTARSPSMAQRIAHALNWYLNPRYRTVRKDQQHGPPNS